MENIRIHILYTLSFLSSLSFLVSFYDTMFTMFLVGVVRISGTSIVNAVEKALLRFFNRVDYTSHGNACIRHRAERWELQWV